MSLLRAAPAKVNLFLDILGKRADGFHDLHTVFSTITLSDVISFERSTFSGSSEREVEVSGEESAGVPTDGRNIVVRALEFYAAELSKKGGEPLPHLRTRLKKTIPHGAGLGGGSSDAAAALLAVNDYMRKPFTRDELRVMAAQVGSDCAFFIDGGTAEGLGRGELLTKWPCRTLHLLLVVPPFQISTAEAFQKLRPEDMGSRSDFGALRNWLMDPTSAVPRLENAFEGALDADHPELRIAREKLIAEGALLARLSGSGSATFGVFPDTEAARHASESLSHDYRCWVCETNC
ncbi:4-(cytidine 5'-diphospho)-2-C-methyl-D-erythritol kinase [soil metagenome]